MHQTFRLMYAKASKCLTWRTGAGIEYARGNDELTDMALRMFGRMKEQAQYIGRDLLSPDEPAFEQGFLIGVSKL